MTLRLHLGSFCLAAALANGTAAAAPDARSPREDEVPASAASVAADTPRRVPRRIGPKPEPCSCGGEVFLADVGVIGGTVAMAAWVRPDTPWPFVGLGSAFYLLTGPAVYAGHGRARRARVSLALRLGLPAFGALAGAGGPVDGDYAALGAAVFAACGAGTAMLLDWTLPSRAFPDGARADRAHRRPTPGGRRTATVGGAMFGAAYGLAVFGSAFAQAPEGLIPVAGPLYGYAPGHCWTEEEETTTERCGGLSPTANAALVLDSAAQGVGLVLIGSGLLAMAVKGDRAPPSSATVVPVVGRDGFLGLAVASRF